MKRLFALLWAFVGLVASAQTLPPATLERHTDALLLTATTARGSSVTIASAFTSPHVISGNSAPRLTTCTSAPCTWCTCTTRRPSAPTAPSNNPKFRAIASRESRSASGRSDGFPKFSDANTPADTPPTRVLNPCGTPHPPSTDDVKTTGCTTPPPTFPGTTHPHLQPPTQYQPTQPPLKPPQLPTPPPRPLIPAEPSAHPGSPASSSCSDPCPPPSSQPARTPRAVPTSASQSRSQACDSPPPATSSVSPCVPMRSCLPPRSPHLPNLSHPHDLRRTYHPQ